MKTILLDTSVNLKLAVMRYPLINNLVRINRYNEVQKQNRIQEMNYNLFNQNVLVGLLQNLAIDPTWTRDYVIAYTKLRSRSLCSAFQIISPHNREGMHADTVFYGGCKECFCLLENTRNLSQATLNDLRALVPIYSSITTFSYLPTAERERKSQHDYRNEVAVIGINLVELAVGWWLYMNDARFNGHGIHHYVACCALPMFETLHNELALFNALYEHLVNKTGYSQLLHGEKLDFNSLAIRDDLLKMEEYWVRQMKTSTWKTHLLLLAYLQTAMTPRLTALFDSTQYDLGYNENVIWGFELNAVKYYQMYLTLVNELSYVPDSTAGALKQLVPLVKSRWTRIDDSDVRDHALMMLNKLTAINA